MEGYRVHIEIRMTWDGFVKAANASLEATINEYYGENVTTDVVGQFYQILIKK